MRGRRQSNRRVVSGASFTVRRSPFTVRRSPFAGGGSSGFEVRGSEFCLLSSAVSRLSRTIDFGLEGCSPLQPGSNKGPILGGYFFRQTKVPSISTAPTERTPSKAFVNIGRPNPAVHGALDSCYPCDTWIHAKDSNPFS